MQIVDTQLHDPAPWLDWGGEPPRVHGMVLTELSLAWLDSLGIAGAVLFPRRGDWAAEAARSLPNRFAVVPNVHLSDAEDWEAFVADARRRTGTVGLRSVLGWPFDGGEARRAEQGEWDPFFSACQNQGMPVFVFATRFLPVVEAIARRFPELRLIVDHLGLPQPPLEEQEWPRFASLPQVLELAHFENVAIKLSGLPGLSRESWPYRDVQSSLRRFVDGFGVDRLMWASDISRFYGRIGFEERFPHAQHQYEGKHTYAESLFFIKESDQLTEAEKRSILGGTACALLSWSPTGSGAFSRPTRDQDRKLS